MQIRKSAFFEPGCVPYNGNLFRTNASSTAVHLVVSAVLTAALLALCLALPHADHATVALLLVAAIVGLAYIWGRAVALTCGIVGGLGFDYFFLPPRGFGISRPEHLAALLTFLFIAAVMGQLAFRSSRLLAQNDSLLRLSLDPLCIGDADGNIRNVNPAMVQLLGWSEKELCSRSFVDFVHPEDRALTKSALARLSAGGSPADFENRCRTRSGEWLWLHWKVAPPASGVTWLSAAAHDVTEEKWAREKLHALAGRVMTAQDEERRRIARELHDDLTQRLAALGIELGLLKQSSAGSDAAGLTDDLSRFQEQILDLSEDVRKLSHSLHPGILEHSSLAASLEMHCREVAAQSGMEATFTAREVPDTIAGPVALALYRIAQESLRNVVRHSGATEVGVVLAGESNSALSLYVIDNGKGFHVRSAKVHPGLGLVSIEERARQIGASVTIESSLGAGTRLMVCVPPSSLPE